MVNETGKCHLLFFRLFCISVSTVGKCSNQQVTIKNKNISDINNIHKNFFHCHKYLKQTLHYGSNLLPSSGGFHKNKKEDHNVAI